MAQDPYGYQASSSTATTAPSVPMWAGIAAALMAMVGPCTCHVTSFLAIFLGGYAVWAGMGARDAGATDEARQMAMAGTVSGGMSALWGLVWVGFITLYILIYVVIFAFVFAAGAAGNDF